MGKSLNKEQDAVVRKLRTKWSKISKLLKRLDDTDEGRLLVSSIKEMEKIIDTNWQFITDEKALNNVRCNKMAINLILDVFKVLRQESDELEKKIQEVDSEVPSSIVRDYDPN